MAGSKQERSDNRVKLLQRVDLHNPGHTEMNKMK